MSIERAVLQFGGQQFVERGIGGPGLFEARVEQAAVPRELDIPQPVGGFDEQANGRGGAFGHGDFGFEQVVRVGLVVDRDEAVAHREARIEGGAVPDHLFDGAILADDEAARIAEVGDLARPLLVGKGRRRRVGVDQLVARCREAVQRRAPGLFGQDDY